MYLQGGNMKQSMFAASICAAVLCAVPALAMDEQNTSTPAATDLSVLSGIEHEVLNDTELAKVEGKANPVAGAGGAGVVNVVAAAAVGVDNIRVIRDITVQDVNVAILGGGQR